VRRALGQPELAVQEVEEARVAQLDPAVLAVEVGEGEQELGHRAMLAAEELGEANGPIVRVGHDETIARGSDNQGGRIAGVVLTPADATASRGFPASRGGTALLPTIACS
jgi:hypothetical protein